MSIQEIIAQVAKLQEAWELPVPTLEGNSDDLREVMTRWPHVPSGLIDIWKYSNEGLDLFLLLMSYAADRTIVPPEGLTDLYLQSAREALDDQQSLIEQLQWSPSWIPIGRMAGGELAFVDDDGGIQIHYFQDWEDPFTSFHSNFDDLVKELLAVVKETEVYEDGFVVEKKWFLTDIDSWEPH